MHTQNKEHCGRLGRLWLRTHLNLRDIPSRATAWRHLYSSYVVIDRWKDMDSLRWWRTSAQFSWSISPYRSVSGKYYICWIVQNLLRNDGHHLTDTVPYIAGLYIGRQLIPQQANISNWRSGRHFLPQVSSHGDGTIAWPALPRASSLRTLSFSQCADREAKAWGWKYEWEIVIDVIGITSKYGGGSLHHFFAWVRIAVSTLRHGADTCFFLDLRCSQSTKG